MRCTNASTSTLYNKMLVYLVILCTVNIHVLYINAFVVNITFKRFESTLAGALVLDARWQQRQTISGEVQNEKREKTVIM